MILWLESGRAMIKLQLSDSTTLSFSLNYNCLLEKYSSGFFDQDLHFWQINSTVLPLFAFPWSISSWNTLQSRYFSLLVTHRHIESLEILDSDFVCNLPHCEFILRKIYKSNSLLFVLSSSHWKTEMMREESTFYDLLPSY